MCPPLLAVAAIGATVASVGVSMYGASKASDAAAAKNEQDQRNYLVTADNYDAQAKSADVNAQLADFNADLSMKSARLTAEQMEFDVSRVRDKSSRIQGAQRAAFGAAGIASGTGTAADVSLDSLTEAEKDIYAIRFDAKVKADAYENESAINRVNAQQIRDNAAQLRKNAGNARQGAIDTAGALGTATSAPYINAAASSLSSVSSLASNSNVTRFGQSLFAA